MRNPWPIILAAPWSSRAWRSMDLDGFRVFFCSNEEESPETSAAAQTAFPARPSNLCVAPAHQTWPTSAHINMGRKPSPTKMPGRAAIFVALCSRTRPARPYVPFVVDGHFTSIFTFFFLFYNFHRVDIQLIGVTRSLKIHVSQCD